MYGRNKEGGYVPMLPTLKEIEVVSAAHAAVEEEEGLVEEA